MAISVTDSTSTIIVDTGDTIDRVMKNKIIVSSYKDNVLIMWDGRIRVNSAYTNFTAPAGASAIIVANAIEAFLDTGIVITATIAGQYAEDSAATSGQTALAVLTVRNDSNAVLTSADGDYSWISVDSTGRLKVILAANSGVDIGDVDVTSVVPGTGINNLGVRHDIALVNGQVGVLAMAVRNDSNSALTTADSNYSQISVDSTGRLKVILATNTGVDIGDVDVTSVIPGTGATNLGKAEDAAHSSGDVGIMPLGVRNDANAALSGTDLDYTPIATDSTGRIKYAQTVATITQSITRPADTTAYAAGDVIATATASGDSTMSFANAVKANDEVGTIIGAILVDSVNAATKGDFDLWLFDTAPADQNDNVAFAPSDAEAETCLGVIQFLAADARSTSNNAVYEGFLQNPITIIGVSATRTIVGVLVVRNAYTPSSGEKFLFRLRIEQY